MNKPCPFCGEKTQTIYVEPTGATCARCDNCSATASVLVWDRRADISAPASDAAKIMHAIKNHIADIEVELRGDGLCAIKHIQDGEYTYAKKILARRNKRYSNLVELKMLLASLKE